MKRATVSFDIEIPDAVSDKQLEDFLRFELQLRSDMMADNPIQEFSDLRPQFMTIFKRD